MGFVTELSYGRAIAAPPAGAVGGPLPSPFPDPRTAEALGPATRPGISAVVLTYNSRRTLGACLAALLPTLKGSDELILVDNASQDGTQADLRSWAGRSPVPAKLLLNQRNLGYSAGCNAGIRACSGEYIALLNPDTAVSPGWRGGLLQRFTDPKTAAVGPVCDNVCGDQYVEFHLAPGDAGPMPLERLAQRVTELHPGASLETRLLIGFCMMVRRSALNEVGLLDEDLFLGGDDLELSLRLRASGHRLLVARDVFVRHEGQASFGTVPRSEAERLLAQSTAALKQKLARLFAPERVPSSTELFGCGILQ